MIRCHLSRLLGEHKKRMAEVARDTGIHRNSLAMLFSEEATRIDFGTVDKLCAYFGCSVGDLLEYVPDPPTKKK